MTAIIILAIALTASVGGLVTLGLWSIRRDGIRSEELMLARERVLTSEQARTHAETKLKEVASQLDDQRLRFQKQISEREQEFIAFRDKGVTTASSAELRSMLTTLLTRRPG